MTQRDQSDWITVNLTRATIERLCPGLLSEAQEAAEQTTALTTDERRRHYVTGYVGGGLERRLAKSSSDQSDGFTDRELVSIAFFASERAWRARLAIQGARIPVTEQAIYQQEEQLCRAIELKAEEQIHRLRQLTGAER